MSQRIHFIDTARGIAILLVIIGHCISTPENPINRFILSFHMPLFFIISGMLMSYNKPQVTFARYVIDKAKRLLLPQILLGSFFYIYAAVKGYMHTHMFDLFMPQHFYASIMNSWFLLVMFVVTILAFIYRKYFIGSYFLQVFFVAAILLLAVWVQITPDHFSGLFAYINLVPMAWLFYVTGFYSKKLLVSQITKKSEFVCLILILITFVVAQINAPVKMFASEYGSIPLFIFTSLATSFVVLKISQQINIQIINWGGCNSIVLYVLHFPVFMCFFDISTKMLLTMNINNEPLRVGLTLACSIPLVFALAHLSERSKVLRYIFSLKLAETK